MNCKRVFMLLVSLFPTENLRKFQIFSGGIKKISSLKGVKQINKN